MKFRKRPVDVHAIQWTGTNRNEIILFAGKHGCYTNRQFWEDLVVISTLAGTIKASPGDWLVKDEGGEWRAYTPDEFATTYERVGCGE